jgi:hypothetical protein
LNDGTAAFGSLSDEVETGELSVPLGVHGHYVERSDRDRSDSVT